MRDPFKADKVNRILT